MIIFLYTIFGYNLLVDELTVRIFSLWVFICMTREEDHFNFFLIHNKLKFFVLSIKYEITFEFFFFLQRLIDFHTFMLVVYRGGSLLGFGQTLNN